MATRSSGVIARFVGGPNTEFIRGRLTTMRGASRLLMSTIETTSLPGACSTTLPASSQVTFSSMPTTMYCGPVGGAGMVVHADSARLASSVSPHLQPSRLETLRCVVMPGSSSCRVGPASWHEARTEGKHGRGELLRRLAHSGAVAAGRVPACLASALRGAAPRRRRRPPRPLNRGAATILIDVSSTPHPVPIEAERRGRLPRFRTYDLERGGHVVPGRIGRHGDEVAGAEIRRRQHPGIPARHAHLVLPPL